MINDLSKTTVTKKIRTNGNVNGSPKCVNTDMTYLENCESKTMLFPVEREISGSSAATPSPSRTPDIDIPKNKKILLLRYFFIKKIMG